MDDDNDINNNIQNMNNLNEECIHAVQCGELNKVITLILHKGVSVNTIDINNCSLLHWGAINQRYNICKFLIYNDANINIIGGDFKETPIYL